MTKVNTRLLILTRDISRRGGAAQFYRKLKPHLQDKAEYFTVGSSGGTVRKAISTAFQFAKFTRRLSDEQIKIVLVNPSLGPRAVMRDAKYIQVAKRRGKRVICMFHGWDWEYAKHLEANNLSWFRKTYSKCDRILVLADEFRQKLLEWNLDVDVELMTTAVEDDFSAKVQRIRETLVPHPFHVLFLARVEQAKGVFEAVEAYRMVREQGLDCTLTVAGDGSALEDVKALVSSQGIPDVSFPGYVRGDAKCRVFAEAHCFLFPSYYGEGMPNCVLEAMAVGLPVITTPVGGIKDFFEDGKMGFLLDSQSPNEFAEALGRLIAQPDESRAMGQYNRKYASNRFMASQVAGRLEQICKEVNGTPHAQK